MIGHAVDEEPPSPTLWLKWMHPNDRESAQHTMKQALEHGPDQFQMEFRLQHSDGHYLRLLSRGFIQRDEQGRAVRVSGTNTDITERAAEQAALRASEEKFRLVAENTSDGIVIYNLEKVLYASPAFARLTGQTDAFENSQSLADVMARIHPEDLPAVELRVRDSLLEQAPQLIYEFRYLHADGHYFYREDSVRFVYNARGGLESAYVIARDVTERREARQQIERLAFFDPLTELCNRRLLTDRLAQALPMSERSQRFGALMFIDLDNFKDLNDTHGHALGDDLLRQAARRLSGLVREGDTVARLGGDEFVLLLLGMGADSDAAAQQAGVLGRKVLKALGEPFHLGDVSHQCTGSVGITLFRGQLQTVDDILKRADVAMYQAKAAGRNCLRFFDPGVQAVVEARSQLEQDLRRSVDREELALFYQPIVNAQTEVVGYEALVRWRHPQRGMVPPSEFIALAESTGLIQPIGRWVLQQACRQLARWAHSPHTEHLTLSVNLSARQLLLPSFVIQVLEVLQREQAPGERLKLEITESLLQDDVEQTILKMQALARHGIRFSLDDFGTGYSSLSYLKRLPLSQLKIDRSFVRDLLTDSNDEAIARMILQLAQTLAMDVVAEGVEEASQLAALREMGCQQFQGYLFGKPGPLPTELLGSS
jgi:diguanylate cyclase (GGDEF)-like protein/PAS domain S-box-containing protein